MDGLNLEVVASKLSSWGMNLLAAAAVVLIGWVAVRVLIGLLARAMSRAGMDDIVAQFARTIARALLMAVVFVIALERLGVQTTSLVAAVGALGLAVGLALQDSLKNFAAGLLLIAQRPFKAGDYVEAGGTAGIVEDLNLITTTLRTPDNRSVIVPNAAIFHDVITNYSARARRRIDMVVSIGYDDDIERAREIILALLRAEARVLKDPEPVVAVNELAGSSVDLAVRPWVETDDYWDVRWGLTEEIKMAFDQHGISIPFPQMDVRVEKVA